MLLSIGYIAKLGRALNKLDIRAPKNYKDPKKIEEYVFNRRIEIADEAAQLPGYGVVTEFAICGWDGQLHVLAESAAAPNKPVGVQLIETINARFLPYFGASAPGLVVGNNPRDCLRLAAAETMQWNAQQFAANKPELQVPVPLVLWAGMIPAHDPYRLMFTTEQDRVVAVDDWGSYLGVREMIGDTAMERSKYMLKLAAAMGFYSDKDVVNGSAFSPAAWGTAARSFSGATA